MQIKITNDHCIRYTIRVNCRPDTPQIALSNNPEKKSIVKCCWTKKKKKKNSHKQLISNSVSFASRLLVVPLRCYPSNFLCDCLTFGTIHHTTHTLRCVIIKAYINAPSFHFAAKDFMSQWSPNNRSQSNEFITKWNEWGKKPSLHTQSINRHAKHEYLLCACVELAPVGWARKKLDFDALLAREKRKVFLKIFPEFQHNFHCLSMISKALV